MSGGVALLDFDNDGLLDIYLTNSLTVDTAHDPRSARSALYRNLGNMRFEDVTDRAGVGHPGWAMGVCTADFDGDGWEDIYVTGFGGNTLYRNDQGRTFTDVAETGRRQGRRLVDGLRLRRLRPGRAARPLREPLRADGPREPARVRQGRRGHEGRGPRRDLPVPRRRGAVRPARPPRRVGLPVPRRRRRALHRGQRRRRASATLTSTSGSASRGSTTTPTAGRISTWPTTPIRTSSTRTRRTARSRRSAFRWASR